MRILIIGALFSLLTACSGMGTSGSGMESSSASGMPENTTQQDYLFNSYTD